jgi:glycosyltransferase involved in cell wall biosynthesis
MAIVFRLRKGDLVLCGTNPSFFLLFVSFLKRFIKFKWLLCVHDVFPRNLVPLGLASENSVFFKLLSFVFQHSYMSVDKLVVIGRDMKDFFLKSGLCEDYIYVIENWYDPNVLAISEQRDLSIFKGIDWEKKIVYQFFGNIGTVQGVKNLVSGLSLVKRKDLLFVFSGDGSESDFLKQHIRCSESTNIFYYGPVPQEEKMLMLAACDVAIVSLVDGMKGLAVPSKAYFSLAANKPLFVIGDKGSELELMMAEHDVGWFCDSSNPQVIANILESIEHSDVLERAGRARKLAIENYSPQRALKQYDALVSELLQL